MAKVALPGSSVKIKDQPKEAESLTIGMSAGKPAVVAVFGGLGYVGSHVVKHLSRHHPEVKVIVISRNAAGPLGSTEFVRGDILDKEGAWGAVLKERGVTACISCVGAFGSDAFMLKVNGEANCIAAQAARDQGVGRFVYVSTVENNLPGFVLRGYFEGKLQAEKKVLDLFPAGAGIVLRPSFVYGTRQVTSALSLPLGIIGRPMAAVLSTPPFSSLQHLLPGMKAVLAPPVSVEHVAAVAASAALGNLAEAPASSILNVDLISKLGKKLLER